MTLEQIARKHSYNMSEKRMIAALRECVEECAKRVQASALPPEWAAVAATTIRAWGEGK